MTRTKQPARDLSVLIVCIAAALIFSFVAALTSYRAYQNLAVFLLYGVGFFAAMFALWYDGYLDSRNALIAAFLLVTAAFALRTCNVDARSGDYNTFLDHWVQFYRDNGGFAALGEPVGNYNFPYLYLLAAMSYVPIDDLYLIKIVSTLFDVLLAFFAMRLTALFTEKRFARLIAYFATLLLPTVFLNSGWWAQCDSIYASFALGALYFGLKRRPILAVLFGTLSFAFKLQAVFLLPIFAVLLMCGRIKWRHVPLFPLFYAVMVLPAIIAGRPPQDAILIYLNQAGEYTANLTLNAPTLAVVFEPLENAERAAAPLVIAAFAYLAFLLGCAWKMRERLNDRLIVLLTLAMCIGIPFLLPYMHERYFYIAEILSIVCAAAGLVHFSAPAVIQLASMICYDAYITGYYRYRLGFASVLMAIGLALSLFALFGSDGGKRLGGHAPLPTEGAPPEETESDDIV